MYLSVDMPEVEMHARGKDCEDDNLEAALWRGFVSKDAQHGLSDVLLQHAVVRVLSVRVNNGSVLGIGRAGVLTWRSSDVNIFTIEKTLETRMIKQ
jgi:hypothetical protein